jgi:hypothetical protein
MSARNTKSCFSKHTMTVSSSTLTTGSAAGLQQCANMVTLAVRFAVSVAISLDGLLLVLLSTISNVVFAVPLLTVVLASASVIAALTIDKIHEAYTTFIALSQGSIPTNGFMRAMKIAQQDITTSNSGYLQAMSLRPGNTPYTIGTPSHRQITQASPVDVRNYCTDRLALFAVQQNSSSNSSAAKITTTKSDSCNCPVDTSIRTFGCNNCCPHGTDGSAHVILHPSDLETVVQNGWGELHPHANTGSYYAPSGAKCYLPTTLVLIYAPRTYPEVCTVMKIVEAGSRYLACLEN